VVENTTKPLSMYMHREPARGRSSKEVRGSCVIVIVIEQSGPAAHK